MMCEIMSCLLMYNLVCILNLKMAVEVVAKENKVEEEEKVRSWL